MKFILNIYEEIGGWRDNRTEKNTLKVLVLILSLQAKMLKSDLELIVMTH